METRRWISGAALLAVGLACLTGCGGVAENGGTTPQPSSPESTIHIGSQQELTRSDEDQLVTIMIAGGQAQISINLGRWERLHDIYAHLPNDNYDITLIRRGPFSINSQSSAVIEACIGKVEALDSLNYGFITPAVVLLMNDGTVEFFLADPFPTAFGWSFTSQRLPHLKDIVSLSYESGETIYARDRSGQTFDIRGPQADGDDGPTMKDQAATEPSSQD
jgi:hypothetical protein